MGVTSVKADDVNIILNITSDADNDDDEDSWWNGISGSGDGAGGVLDNLTPSLPPNNPGSVPPNPPQPTEASDSDDGNFFIIACPVSIVVIVVIFIIIFVIICLKRRRSKMKKRKHKEFQTQNVELAVRAMDSRPGPRGTGGTVASAGSAAGYGGGSSRDTKHRMNSTSSQSVPTTMAPPPPTATSTTTATAATAAATAVVDPHKVPKNDHSDSQATCENGHHYDTLPNFDSTLLHKYENTKEPNDYYANEDDECKAVDTNEDQCRADAVYETIGHENGEGRSNHGDDTIRKYSPVPKPRKRI